MLFKKPKHINAQCPCSIDDKVLLYLGSIVSCTDMVLFTIIWLFSSRFKAIEKIKLGYALTLVKLHL